MGSSRIPGWTGAWLLHVPGSARCPFAGKSCRSRVRLRLPVTRRAMSMRRGNPAARGADPRAIRRAPSVRGFPFRPRHGTPGDRPVPPRPWSSRAPVFGGQARTRDIAVRAERETLRGRDPANGSNGHSRATHGNPEVSHQTSVLACRHRYMPRPSRRTAHAKHVRAYSSRAGRPLSQVKEQRSGQRARQQPGGVQRVLACPGTLHG